MRNIVYVAPFPMAATLRFAEALATLDNVRLLGVFQRPPHPSKRELFHDVFVVRNALDVSELLHAVGTLGARHGGVDRVLGILEVLQEVLGSVRDHFDLPGERRATAELFRDKGRMKDALRAAGLPCAAHARLRSREDAVAFASRHGFPFVMKPAAGMGCRATYRVSSPGALQQALAATRPSPENPVLAEEFLTGDEYSFETLTVNGEPRFFSINHYHPTPLEVMENDWLQWVVTMPRKLEGMDAAVQVGVDAVKKLGLHDGMTHMEWFRRRDGRVAIGEIAMRPPGAEFVRLMSVAYEADMYRAWARATVDRAYDGPFVQKHSVGIAYLRGVGQGRVLGVTGVAAAQQAVGEHVVDVKLPVIGAPKSDSYEGDGWVIVRHPTDEGVNQVLRQVVSTIRVHYAR
ncbi:MAG: ATP-grasp domain-containing protein [Myxococcales bacterium]|nr:ATP-grasp domain-containing protein [Myxococcales bacterium]MCB9671075.1 ATP-grasp domain-containing protein [Alphaproteobacteria bacterium]MCB9692331.1 ATP-grasp domain-containing protein [Alphaproteobacteria bacterium]